jgi:pimeloyl-ACP methyl ester carboxylesterase
MATKALQVRGVELCVETFGDPGAPPLLLIAGSGASMDWWEEDFCERLAAGRRFVIRYDHRDTGQSVSYPPGKPGYTGDDLIADAVGILDALGLGSAHVVGMSIGGALTQILALDYPDRVASLTLISTSPAGPGEPDLPDMNEEGRARFAAAGAPDWSDRDRLLDHLVALDRACASATAPYDEAGTRARWERILDRTRDIRSTLRNHELAEGSGRWRERLPSLRAPTLVIHGTDDPMFPVQHGAALAREIPEARLLTLGGAGHELPPRVWDVVVPAILEHTRA